MLPRPDPSRPRRPRLRGSFVLVLGLAALTACDAAFTALPPAIVTAPPAPIPTATETPAPSAATDAPPIDVGGAGLRVPILLYHVIADPSTPYPGLFVTPVAFESQMAAIAASKVTTLTMEELVTAVRTGGSFPAGAVAVTFDDASEDQYATAFPILKRYGVHASLFIPTARVGLPGHLTWPQLREMVTSGIVSVEAHSITHRDLTTMDDTRAFNEIARSRAIIRAQLGVPVSAFAYPYGRFSARIEGMVTRAGYYCAVTTEWRWTHSPKDALTWGRMEVHTGFAGAYLADLARISGSWIEATDNLQTPPVRRRRPVATSKPTPAPGPTPGRTPAPSPRPTATKTT